MRLNRNRQNLHKIKFKFYHKYCNPTTFRHARSHHHGPPRPTTAHHGPPRPTMAHHADFIETGAWRGGSSIFAASVLEYYGELGTRSVWLADSFKGIPPVKPGLFPADAAHKVRGVGVV